MSSVSSGLALMVATGLAAATLASAEQAPLRVCADPNNMPFSNERGEGFENRIAALVARDLGRPLTYFWWPQRRGFLRHSLDAKRCDVVMGVPVQSRGVRVTHSYYRSTYVFVSKRERHLHVDSFDAPVLASLRIGIQVSGDDYNNPPAAQMLAERHLVQQVRGFTVYGDYAQPDPQRDIVDAVADGRVDIAVVWGPLAGYYAKQQSTRIDITPVALTGSAPASPMTFEIAMAVRRDDVATGRALDAAIGRRGAAIRRVLRAYGVPLR